MGSWVAGFVQRLRGLGWIEGRNIVIDLRWAQGRVERAAEIAADFVKLKVDLIVTGGTANIEAARRATSTIPIVFAAATDPVGTGLVASLGRPGGNVTGLSIQGTDLAGKRMEILREVVPHLSRVAILVNTAASAAILEFREAQAALQMLGLSTVALEIQRAADIENAIAGKKGQVDALYVVPEPVTLTNRTRINSLALSERLPTMHAYREFVESGGLMSYGPNLADLWRRAAEYADKILRGAKPGDLPVEQPTKFDLVINLQMAKALALEIPPTLIARADEVIE
jgi:putative ABC transport system substrate-binding protein